VRAAVEEAHAFGRYVCAHAYSAEAITRAARFGVRTIEHGNLIDDAAAKLMAEKGMYLVANLVTYYAMKERAAKFGMSAESLEKNDIVLEGGLRSLEICKRHGVQSPTAATSLGSYTGTRARVHTSARGRCTDRDHPLGHDHTRANPEARRQGRHARAWRLCGSPAGRRRSPPGPRAAGRPGKIPVVIMKPASSTNAGCTRSSHLMPANVAASLYRRAP
jgi:hypothetical protein